AGADGPGGTAGHARWRREGDRDSGRPERADGNRGGTWTHRPEGQGMSQRAIAEAVGVGLGTVQRDLEKQVTRSGSPGPTTEGEDDERDGETERTAASALRLGLLGGCGRFVGFARILARVEVISCDAESASEFQHGKPA